MERVEGSGGMGGQDGRCGSRRIKVGFFSKGVPDESWPSPGPHRAQPPQFPEIISYFTFKNRNFVPSEVQSASGHALAKKFSKDSEGPQEDIAPPIFRILALKNREKIMGGEGTRTWDLGAGW